VEFGLIRESGGVRAYGAGILSSVGELEYSVNSPQPHRLPLQLERTMRTLYKIDTYQQTYFVIDDMPHLLNLADADFAPLYEQLRQLPTIGAKELLPGEQLI
jgi:phenylalanine-4-hydroxylase